VAVVRAPQIEGTEDRSALDALLREAGCNVISIAADEAGRGMGATLASGVRASKEAAGWIVALADMPYVRVETILAIERALAAGARTVAPYYAGVRGHPVGFDASCASELLALDGDCGARAVLARHVPLRIEVDDAGILADIDTPGDLERGPAPPKAP
jgi:molybdenum cofactor cytidylyltransferase